MTRRFFASRDAFSEGSITLDTNETRHLRDVLRLKVGDEIAVFDGLGKECLARISAITKRSAVAVIISPTQPSAPESPLRLTLAPVVIPGDKFDLVIQKSVELGISHIVPLASLRGEVKLADAAKRITRWERIALDAAKQCGRATLMTIGEPEDVKSFLAETDGPAVFFSEREGGRLPEFEMPKALTVVIGPKGGWDDSELRAAHDRGIPIVTLGGRIMRAETAAIALSAILQHRFGDIN